MFRIWIFILAGIAFANVGWFLGQLFITELTLGKLIRPEIIMMAWVSVCIASSIILTELIVSNPFRHPFRPNKFSNLSKNPILIALGFGLFTGIVAGLVYWGLDSAFIRKILNLPDSWYRAMRWILVAVATVVAESLAWQTTTIEASDRKRFWKRFWFTLVASVLLAWLASGWFEGFRQSFTASDLKDFKRIESPLGFMLLGGSLGLALGLCTSPSYVASLRAGAGFEYRASASCKDGKISIPPLSFVGEFKEPNIKQGFIEEGLTIRLPSKSLTEYIFNFFNLNKQMEVLNGGILIGSSDKAHIKLEGVAPELCRLKPEGNTYILEQLTDNGGSNLAKVVINPDQSKIKHNSIITFYHENDHKKFYRFVYYNRFLDPFS